MKQRFFVLAFFLVVLMYSKIYTNEVRYNLYSKSDNSVVGSVCISVDPDCKLKFPKNFVWRVNKQVRFIARLSVPKDVDLECFVLVDDRGFCYGDTDTSDGYEDCSSED